MSKSDQTEEKLTAMQAAMEDKKAENVVVIDLRGKSLMADYFVVCTAHSRPQFNAIVEAVRERFRDEELRKPSVEGVDSSKWVLLDAGDVIGHVFAPEERAFYNIEGFWEKAKPVAA
ncbi:MAG TPA: ribosome silencing factor [Armatimonadota bacterium]|jgi:ribosome-associated protein